MLLLLLLLIFKGEKPYEVKQDVENTDDDCINLPATDAYYEEILYFAKCVMEDKPVDIIKPEELETVLELMKNFEK
jgi:hypothetical protein